MHGYLSTGKSFYNQIQFFSKYFNVYAPDLKGFGDNVDMPYPYSLDDYVDEVREYVLSHNIVKPLVVAHSFGARIVLKGLYDKRLDFEKVVITGGAGLKPKRSLKKIFKKIRFNFYKHFVPRQKLVRFYSPDYLALNQTMKQSFVKIVGETLDYTLPYIKTPTLLIFGKNDKETPLYMARRFEKNLVNSSLTVFDNAGHFCFISDANKFNLEVREFLLS